MLKDDNNQALSIFHTCIIHGRDSNYYEDASFMYVCVSYYVYNWQVIRIEHLSCSCDYMHVFIQIDMIRQFSRVSH